MPGADIIDILGAFSVWETLELPYEEIPGAVNFKSFPTLPTEDDIDIAKNGPLLFPFCGHWTTSSDWLSVSVNNTNSVEDQQTHEIVSILVYGQQRDSLAALILRDAKWRNAYRRAFLKHLQFGLTVGPLGAHSITATMGTTTPLGFDLLNMQMAGIQTPVKIVVRQGLPTQA